MSIDNEQQPPEKQTWQPSTNYYGTPAGPLIPAVTTTVVITILFGVFGAIPASMHTNRALTAGVRTSKYWKAFGITMAASIAAFVLFIVILVAAASSSANNS